MDEEDCAHCGKTINMEAGPRLILRPLSTGEHEEILVCQECRHLFDDHIKYLFTILDGPTCTDEESASSLAKSCTFVLPRPSSHSA